MFFFYIAEPVIPNQESMVTKSTLNPSLQSRLSPAVAKPTKTSIETLRPGFQRDSLNQDNQEVCQFLLSSKKIYLSIFLFTKPTYRFYGFSDCTYSYCNCHSNKVDKYFCCIFRSQSKVKSLTTKHN